MYAVLHVLFKFFMRDGQPRKQHQRIRSRKGVHNDNAIPQSYFYAIYPSGEQ